MKAILQDNQPAIFTRCQGHRRRRAEKQFQVKEGEGDVRAQCDPALDPGPEKEC